MDKKAIYTKNAPKPVGPYNQAIEVNGVLYVSGQIALDTKGNLLQTNIAQETYQVMKNLSAILKEANLDFENVVKCSIFILDMGNFKQINEVYATYFGDVPPARETVAVKQLPLNANVEISCIAVR